MKNRGIAFRLSFSILASCTVIFLLIFGYNYLFSRKSLVKKIDENAENVAMATVNKIETVIRSVENVPKTIAALLEETSCDSAQVVDLLRLVVQGNPEIYGSTIAFEPYAFDPQAKYFAPYFYKKNGHTEFTYLGSEAYNYFLLDWYQIPKEVGRPVWSEPYYDEGGGNTIMSTYSVPFYRKIEGKRAFTGVVTADISLSWLQDLVSSIKIGRTGYAFLITGNGTFITHPSADLIMHETVFSLAESRGDDTLREIGRHMINGNKGFVPYISMVTGKKCWMVYAPLPSNGWALGVLFPQDELMEDIFALNRIVLFLGLAGFFILLIVIVLVSGSITKPLRILDATTKSIGRGNLDFAPPAIKSNDEVGRLANSFVFMRDELKRSISELKIAHDIQMNIVKKEFPAFPERREFDIFALMEPAREVGGDLYDFFFIDSDNLCFVIGDVSGKGVPAALFMAMTKILIKITAKETRDVGETLKLVNNELTAGNDACLFVTVFCGILNVKTGALSYCNGGHNAPFFIRADG
ncbi:MAG: cache domain-containing protein, partial [Candidatus Omnitrophota bacterium]